jgi:uridine phosphorylase
MLCKNEQSSQVKSEVPFNPDGTVLHLGVQRGQISNRLITVGQAERAIFLAKSLLSQVTITTSPRHFTVCTGIYKETAISIVAIGMGYPNMDFFLREARAVAKDGPMFVVRLGTCGSFDNEAAPIGSIITPVLGAIQINEQFGAGLQLYSKTLFPDAELTRKIIDNTLGILIRETSHCSCDTFYFSQGKYSADFDDAANEGLVSMLRTRGVKSIDMETWYLFYLAAKCISKRGAIHAAALAIPNANRVEGLFLTNVAEREALELSAGQVIMEALIAVN